MVPGHSARVAGICWREYGSHSGCYVALEDQLAYCRSSGDRGLHWTRRLCNATGGKILYSTQYKYIAFKRSLLAAEAWTSTLNTFQAKLLCSESKRSEAPRQQVQWYQASSWCYKSYKVCRQDTNGSDRIDDQRKSPYWISTNIHLMLRVV